MLADLANELLRRRRTKFEGSGLGRTRGEVVAGGDADVVAAVVGAVADADVVAAVGAVAGVDVAVAVAEVVGVIAAAAVVAVVAVAAGITGLEGVMSRPSCVVTTERSA